MDKLFHVPSIARDKHFPASPCPRVRASVLTNPIRPDTILTVSIIVNNYNYARFVSEAIDSALHQSYPHVEVIVVDDGSTDTSREIINNYGHKIVPIFKENGGQASAFNAGLAASSGEIIIFLDADDYLFPYTVERVVTAWKPGIAKVQYRLEAIDAEGNSIGIHPPRSLALDSGEVLSILLNKGRYCTPVTSGNAFSREFLLQILPVPEAEFRLSADGYLVTLAPFYGQVLAIEEALGAYRLHGNNLWASKGVEGWRFRRSVQHDLQRYRILANKANELGYAVPQDLSYRDYLHLKNRLASLCLDARNHPVPSDSLMGLIYRGVQAIWQDSELNWKKRLKHSLWFFWVGLMPLPVAKLAIARL